MATGLSAVRAAVVAAAERAGRDPAEITLVGVSKYATDEAMLRAYDEGLRDFGENRAEDLAVRVALLPGDVRWHFVGRLQGNKVRRVRPVTHLLHSLDRVELASYWMKGPGAPPPALVQVNLGREPQKGGVAPEGTLSLVAAAVALGIDVRGLMTVPPLAPDGEAARPYFRALRELRDRIATSHPGVRELSMGMTDDFAVAVAEGATVLRVGRAIFGPIRDGD
ncbi:MAG: YggS family pyridoxal phosphate enzyme [Actinobacteria bacterium RBG_16_68_21]|nr:MAG: YggS family pyridoxal phosphate enzyme [Actinobacteria bacterium RBG_16_68_21]